METQWHHSPLGMKIPIFHRGLSVILCHIGVVKRGGGDIMLVSTKGRYALRVMIDLAEHRSEGRTPLKKIAARQGISEKYLENILSTLVRHGLLSGLRGKGGGYCLTREPGEFNIGEILRLTEGSLCPVACLEHGRDGCERADRCRTVCVWRELDSMISDYLDSVTLADLMREPDAHDEVTGPCIP